MSLPKENRDFPELQTQSILNKSIPIHHPKLFLGYFQGGGGQVLHYQLDSSIFTKDFPQKVSVQLVLKWQSYEFRNFGDI